ncbi:DnaJ family domain-containing protein [Streptomyces sp. NPDC003691]
MTERKPPGVGFDSWVDKQIRDAERRGEFAALPGVGRPLPEGIEAPYDENWWIKRKMAREGFAALPPSLALRKEAEDVLEAAWAAPSAEAARRLVEAINPRIRQMMLMPPPGPPLGLKPFDLDGIAREWHARRSARDSGPESGSDSGAGSGAD